MKPHVDANSPSTVEGVACFSKSISFKFGETTKNPPTGEAVTQTSLLIGF